MPTPSERLQKIIDAYTPSEAVFKAMKSNGESVILESVITKKSSVRELTEDKDLQNALQANIQEQWDPDEGKYFINSTVDVLWNKITHSILREYESVSKRCDATRRKTQQFIREIKVSDKYLPDYLIQVFLKINSSSYNEMTQSECEALFEQFESLRRTYGKRNR